jgi:hypothetical protein
MAKNNITKTTGKIIRQGKNFSIEEASADDPIYTQGFVVGARNLKTTPESSSKEFIFQGSQVGGLDIDIYALSGLNLTLEDIERITDEISSRDLIVNALDVEEIELYEIDDSPMHSDTYYEYRCGDYDDFIKRLRAWIVLFLE